MSSLGFLSLMNPSYVFLKLVMTECSLLVFPSLPGLDIFPSSLRSERFVLFFSTFLCVNDRQPASTTRVNECTARKSKKRHAHLDVQQVRHRSDRSVRRGESFEERFDDDQLGGFGGSLRELRQDLDGFLLGPIMAVTKDSSESAKGSNTRREH